jgi:bacteriocin-like protein
MSHQPDNEIQQSMTPEETRQHLLAELEASQQAIAELSNEELEKITGGAGVLSKIFGCFTCGKPSGRTSANQNPFYDPNWRPTPTPSIRNSPRWSPGLETIRENTPVRE